MKKSNSQILVEVEDQLAIIDRVEGVIHVVENDQLERFHMGLDVDVITTQLVISANSGGWRPGDGKPPWAGHPGGRHNKGSQNDAEL